MWQEKQNALEWMLCFYPDWRLFLQQKTPNKHLSKTWLLEDLVAFRIRVCESNYLKTEFWVKKKKTNSELYWRWLIYFITCWKTDKWATCNDFDIGCNSQQNLPPGGDEDVFDLMWSFDRRPGFTFSAFFWLVSHYSSRTLSVQMFWVLVFCFSVLLNSNYFIWIFSLLYSYFFYFSFFTFFFLC